MLASDVPVFWIQVLCAIFTFRPRPTGARAITHTAPRVPGVAREGPTGRDVKPIFESVARNLLFVVIVRLGRGSEPKLGLFFS